LGRVVHLGKVDRFIRSTPAFRSRDIELLVGSRGYALLLLHNLEKAGRVTRVTKGWYSVHDDPTFAVFAFKPAYLGLQEALSIRGLWEQETNVVLVTSARPKPGTRVVMGGSNLVVHRIASSRFFGYDYLSYHGAHVPVSDLEKTFIDLLYFRESPGRDVLKTLGRRVDRERLRSYLSHYPAAFARRVIDSV
jgi:predicted transcriptional regulator of viral defense system